MLGLRVDRDRSRACFARGGTTLAPSTLGGPARLASLSLSLSMSLQGVEGLLGKVERLLRSLQECLAQWVLAPWKD